MTKRLVRIACAIGLLGLWGCGPDAPPPPTAQPMTPVASTTPERLQVVEVPRVEQVRFEPDRPIAGRSARAVVKMRSDAPNLRLEYVWKVGVHGGDAERARIDLTRARPGERLEVVVTPFIGDEAGIPYSHSVRLSGPQPRVLGVSFVPAEGLTANATVEARPIVEDADPRQASYRYQWLVNGRRESAYESTFDTSGLERGDTVQVEVIVSAAGETSEPYLSETIELVNAAPRLVRRPLGLDDGGGLDARLEAVDPDGDAPLRFELVRGPDGLELSPDGHLVWPADRVQPGSHPVEVAVSDALGAKRGSQFSLDVGAPAAPAP